MVTDSLTLRELRQRLGASQQRVAEELGTTQPGVLKIERSEDPQLSTLRRYVDALRSATSTELELRISVVLDGERLQLGVPRTKQREMGVSSVSTGNHWRLRAWDDQRLEQRWLDEGLVSISDDEIGDLTVWPGDDEVRRRLEAEFERREDQRTAQAYGTFVRYWRYFRFDMNPGDLVAVPLSRRRVGIAEVEGDYRYQSDEPDSRMRHVRRVRWGQFMERSELSEPIRRVVNAPGTICRIQSGELAC